MKKQILITLFILLFLGIGTTIAILYGKGYRFDFTGSKSILKGTGLLVATSTPDGASVFVNDHLTTATNNTINLAPGDYAIRIEKEGYFPWKKTIHVQEEIVSKAEATLFPTAPKLESITSTGILSPTLDPSLTKIAYVVASQSAKKNGIYVLNMANRSLLTLQSSATQITDGTAITFDNAVITWSPDGSQLLASISSGLRPTTYLLDATGFNVSPKDVTETLSSVTAGWDKLRTDKQTAQLNTLKPALKTFAIANMNILSWSEDETRFLYTASQSATLPQIVIPKIIGTDSTKEDRELTKGNVYVYDSKEDKNFLILKEAEIPDQKVMWLPDSTHLLVVHDKRVDIREYDGGNNTTLYAGPFLDKYVFPWSDGSQIVVLTNLNNQDILPNLYTISLK